MKFHATAKTTLYDSLVRRDWTAAERLLVQRGFAGRLLVAIEPLICAIGFFALFCGSLFLPHDHHSNLPGAAASLFSLPDIIAPIFALAFLCFAFYAVGVMVQPTRALFSTHSPIYIVDGYLRYRTTHLKGRRNTSVSVMTYDCEAVAEWIAAYPLPIEDDLYPAHVEFSRYGGILRIDGCPLDPPLVPIARFGIGTFSGNLRSSDL